MNKTLKTTNNMETKTIYHNAEKTASDIANVHRVKTSINSAVEKIISLKADPKHALSVIQGIYSDIRNEYIAFENQKLEAAEALLGASNALIEVARVKILEDAEKLVNDLQEKIRPLEVPMHAYLEYFAFVGGVWTIRKAFEKTVQIKNSIVLTDPVEIELYEKYVWLIDLLNELKGERANLQTVIYNLAKYDFNTNEFTINFKNFDKNSIFPAY